MKIQYLGLETAVYADLATLQVLARVAAWAFPKAFDFGWVVTSLQVSPFPSGACVIVALHSHYLLIMFRL